MIDSKDYKQKADLAFARKSALNEIEMLIAFDLDAERLRKEIEAVMVTLKAKEAVINNS